MSRRTAELDMAISEKELKLLMNFVKDDLKEARESEDTETKNSVTASSWKARGNLERADMTFNYCLSQRLCRVF